MPTAQEYQAKLSKQARGASVTIQMIIQILLYPGEIDEEDDTMLFRWADISRRLPSMNALRASASKAESAI